MQELFFMVKGDMELPVMEHGRRRLVPIREGEAFLLPSRIPHSPQRSADSIGIVVERERAPTEHDGLRWYVPGTAATDSPRILYQRWFPCTDLNTQVKEGIEEFLRSEEHRTGEPARDYEHDPDQPYPTDMETDVVAPIPLRAWVEEHGEGVGPRGFVYGGGEASGGATLQKDAEFSLEIKRGRPGEDAGWQGAHPEGEVFFWQQQGELTLTVGGGAGEERRFTVGPGHVFLLPKGDFTVSASVR